MKKIVILHHSGLIGGGSKSFVQLWESLIRNGYDVQGVFPHSPDGLEGIVKKRNLKYSTFSYSLGKITSYSGGNSPFSIRYFFHLIKIFFQFKKVRKMVKSWDADYIICNSLVICWIGLLKNDVSGKILCFVRETMEPKNILTNKLYCVLLKRFDRTIFLSKFDQNSFKIQNGLVCPDYFDEIDNLIYRGKEDGPKLRKNSFSILFMGGYDRIKGIDVLLESLLIEPDRKYQVNICGNDYLVRYKGKNFIKMISITLKNMRQKKFILKMNKIMEKLINDGLEIIDHGVVLNVTELIKNTDVLVIPMTHPHQSRPVFEAGLYNKPVIITDYPNIREFVVDGINGLVFENQNPNDLSKKIEKISSNKVYAFNLGRNNYEFSIRMHNEKDSLLPLLQYLREG